MLAFQHFRANARVITERAATVNRRRFTGAVTLLAFVSLRWSAKTGILKFVTSRPTLPVKRVENHQCDKFVEPRLSDSFLS